MTTDPPVPPGVGPATPGPARLCDSCLGGTTSYVSDRMVAGRLRDLIPGLEDTAYLVLSQVTDDKTPDGTTPAVVHGGEWGADAPDLAGSDGSRWLYCGVARCP